MHKYVSRRRMLTVILVLAALGVCGVAVAKDKKSPKIKGPLVDVTLTEYAIAMPPALRHGWITFRIVNNGDVPHGLNGQDAKKTYSLVSQVPPHASVLVPIKLKKGSFMIYCSTREHADAGMQAVAYVQ